MMKPMLAIVFVATTSAAQAAPILLERMTSDRPVASASFGEGVALTETLSVVGSPDADTFPDVPGLVFDLPADGNVEDAGAVYVLSNVSGLVLQRLTANDAETQSGFGREVDISGTTIIVGASSSDVNGVNSGSAYLFDATTGQQLHQLVGSGTSGGHTFGRGVAISGSKAVVGAPNQDNRTFDDGSVYVFDVATGTQLLELRVDDPVERRRLGWDVDIDGNVIIAGTANDPGPAGNQSGAAYVFDATTGALLNTLTADDAVERALFGRSVAVSGSTAIVGAQWDSAAGSKAGAAYLFDLTTGEQIAKLLPQDVGSNDYFGEDVAISGDLAVVTSEFGSSAYIFDARTGAQLAKIARAGVSSGFASAAALADDFMLIGSKRENNNTGAAYLYDVSEVSAPIPLPAAIWLLGSALGLMALRTRRVRECAQ